MINISKPTAEQMNVLLDHSMANQNSTAKSLKNSNSITGSTDLSSGLLSVDKTQKILQHELVGKLEQRFQLEGVELKGLKAEDYTPDKVANRILSFVSAGIGRAGDDEEKSELMDKARQGIEQGFKDAREILDAIGVLNGKVKEDIDKTYDLIQAGLNKLADPQVEEKEQESKLQSINQAALSETSSDQSRRTSVEITTRDGDKITIDMAREQNKSSSAFYADNGNQSIYGASSSSSSYTNIQYQVNGDLDKGEQAAIDDLLNQLSGVAKDFYQGDIEKAFNKAKEVGFDSSELAEFSVDMSFNQSSQSAVSVYQNIQQDNRQLESDSGQEEDNTNQSAFIKDAANFMQRLDGLMKHNAFNFLTEADKTIADLLTASVDLQAEQGSKNSSSGTVNGMVQALQNRSLESEL